MVEQRRPVEERNWSARHDCASGVGCLRRLFNPRVSFVVPAAFRMKMGWNLPARGDPKWENLVREGEIRPEPEPPTLGQFIEAQK